MEIACEGWLRKAPAEKRFFRTKWEARWFVLKSGDLPGQYLLEYFTDQSYKKLKGKVDLDQCRQVDINHDPSHPDDFLFSIRTTKRIFFLGAPNQSDLNRWIQALCSVCHLRIQKDAIDSDPFFKQNIQSTRLHSSLPTSLGNHLSITSTYSNPHHHSTANHTERFETSTKSRSSFSSSSSSSSPAPPSTSSVSNSGRNRIWMSTGGSTLPKNHRSATVPSIPVNAFATLPAPPRRASAASSTSVVTVGPYIPISECHTGRSIFHVNRIQASAGDHPTADCNKENSAVVTNQRLTPSYKPSRLDFSFERPQSPNPFSSNQTAYDVPRSSQSEHSNLPDSVNASELDEGLYANSSISSQEPRQETLNQTNTMLNEINEKCQNDLQNNTISALSVSPGPPSIPPPPPPRPPKPASISRRSESRRSATLLDQVPSSDKINLQQTIDQMYSIPRPSAKQLPLDLDAIVPAPSDSNQPFSNVRSYSNAAASFLTTPADQLLTYEYRPNLPLFSDNCDLKTAKSNKRLTNSASVARPQSHLLLPQTPLTPLTTFASTSASADSVNTDQPIQNTSGSSRFRFPESGADLHDVFGPPLVNRQLKPKKLDSKSAQSILPSMADDISIYDPIKNSSLSMAPRIPSRGRQFVKKDSKPSQTPKLIDIDSVAKSRTSILSKPLLEPDSEIQYLDLDLDGESVSLGCSIAEQALANSCALDLDLSENHYSHPISANVSLNTSINSFCNQSIGSTAPIVSTVYKTVDFVKTKAFNDVRGGIHRKAQT